MRSKSLSNNKVNCKMKKILIVEDEQNIARMITLELEREGYTCRHAADGEEGLRCALAEDYDLLILDVMLPRMDGFALLEQLRRAKDTAVLMLTARGEIEDRVRGLDLGADDYLAKPFDLRELAARVRAALRRSKSEPSTMISYGPLQADRLSLRCFWEGEEILLARKEFELLVYFMEHPNTPCSRDQLLREVWGYDFSGDTNLVDVYIRYLRAKIDNRYGVHYIRTVRGIGYAFGKSNG